MFYFNLETDYTFNWEDLDGREGTFIVTEDDGYKVIVFYCKTGNTFIIHSGKSDED